MTLCSRRDRVETTVIVLHHAPAGEEESVAGFLHGLSHGGMNTGTETDRYDFAFQVSGGAFHQNGIAYQISVGHADDFR